MKTFQMIIFIILGALAGIFIYSQFQPKPDNSAIIAKWKAEKKELTKDAERYITEIGILQHRVDSLKTLPEKIIIKTEKEITKIDSVIAKDSTQSIPEIRSSLALWGVTPDSTEYPTYREFGFAAKYLRKGYGLSLQVNSLLNIVSEQDNLIDKQVKLLEIKDNIIQSDSLIIAGQGLLIKEKDSFWRNRFIWYIGVGANYDGRVLEPGIQMGIGLRIIGNE